MTDLYPGPDDDLATAMEGKRDRRLAHNQVAGEMRPEAVEVPDYQAYKKIVDSATQIFCERNSTRRSAFREAGAKGQLVEMRKKLDRLWTVWGREWSDKDLDEALDLINATVFFIMMMDEDELNGNWPWP